MDVKELKKELEYKNKSAFDSITEDELERSFAYAESYKLFLDSGKTEREAVAYAIAMAKRHGYAEYKLFLSYTFTELRGMVRECPLFANS